MKFKSNSRRRALEYEKDWVERWKADRTFEKSVENRPQENKWVFYDGPPFLTGTPHHGHLLVSAVKDAMGRFHTMKGQRVERTWGWDCHGLPAEVYVEKELGIKNKKEIGDKISIPEYVTACRQSMVKTGTEWEDTIERLGRWVEFQGAYKTMDKEYMESIWWAFKELYEKGKIYEGEKILIYCTKDATPISKSEVAMENSYQTDTDPSVFVYFKLVEESEEPKDKFQMAVDVVDVESKEFAQLKKDMYITDSYEKTLRELAEKDQMVLVAAKVEDRYVGRAVLRYDWTDDAQRDNNGVIIEDEYPGLPQVNALEVDENYRRGGVATRLMKRVELEAKRRGFEKVGLGVEVSNQPAMDLYERDGYEYVEVAGKDTYDLYFPNPDGSGVKPYKLRLMVKELSKDDSEYLLAWTTTPWTLPANTAAAVNPSEEYSLIEHGGKKFYVATEALGRVMQDEKHQPLEYKVLKTISGEGLVGRKYEPLFINHGPEAHRVLAADFVTTADGTGIVHQAPAYGEDDYEISKKHGIPIVSLVDGNGNYTEGPWEGENIWEVNKTIAKELSLPKNEPKDVNVVILHGIEGKAGEHWQGWLSEQLKQRGFNVIMPTLPQADHPDRQAWLDKVGEATKGLDLSKTIFVGHSLGVPAALDFIETADERVLGLVSVSGFYEVLNLELNDYFMKAKQIDLKNASKKLFNAAVYYGDNDPYVGQEYLQNLADGLGVRPVVLAGAGHINGASGYTEFEALLKKVIAISGTGSWRGKAFRVEYVRHEYPHCHRCGTKLMYRAHPSWFMDIQGQKQEMLEQADATNWTPQSLKEGRFHNIIEQAPDWNLSRDRYWATPIPVWKGETADGVEVIKVFGSYDEFEQATGQRLDDYHLPQVMDIEFEHDGATMRHIGKVLDCWFESGSMPFAQFHYPFENKDKFESMFPADFIIEAIDQTRGWFYSLMAVNVGLFGKAPWKNLICTGFINAADGKKMSKKLKNYTDPIKLMDETSADSFRFLLLASPLTTGENFALADRYVVEVSRKLAMIWNMYDFFTMYAAVDGWEWKGSLDDPLEGLENPLDRWVVSRLHQLQQHIEQGVDAYDLQKALEPVLPFLDDASNWYVRRSRRRFWKSEDDSDKNEAYRTLHYVLVRLSMLLAPFTPFLSEELYTKLTGDESVHLLDWPQLGGVDEAVLRDMAQTRQVIEQGLAARMRTSPAEEQIKVRQPLSQLSYSGRKLGAYYEAIIADEVNVKNVHFIDGKQLAADVDKNITPELQREGMVREAIRAIQNARKQAGLNVDDRIVLHLQTASQELQKALKEHAASLRAETLTQQLGAFVDGMFRVETKIDGSDLLIALQKA